MKFEGCALASNAEVLLLDASAALALVDPTSKHHGAALASTRGRRLGLSGHAEFEVLSVLTRLPYPARLAGPAAARLIATDFPHTRHLDTRLNAALIMEFAELGITGGAVYDGLVAACARAHGLELVSGDLRAQRVYDALGATYRIVGA